MIQNQALSSLFILILLLVFYLFQIFQRVKLVYLFRSFGYHFRNIFLPYNSDDLSVSSSGTSLINYFHYFHIFFFLLINGVIISYYGAWHEGGGLKSNKISYDLFMSYFNFNLLIMITLFIRFLVIRFVLELFISFKLKLIFKPHGRFLHRRGNMDVVGAPDLTRRLPFNITGVVQLAP